MPFSVSDKGNECQREMNKTGLHPQKLRSPEGKGRPRKQITFILYHQAIAVIAEGAGAGTEQTAPESGWGWEGDWELKEYLWNDQE